MSEMKAFQINLDDNVATALTSMDKGTVDLIGDTIKTQVVSINNIPKGHKIALKNIVKGEDIIKYGVVIARATMDIKVGEWVHLHNIQSVYDERSSHLDAVTGAPKDTIYK